MQEAAQEARLRQIQSQKKLVQAWFRSLQKKSSGALNKMFHPAHAAAFEQIDCLSCARCCTQVGPLFTSKDIERISKHMGSKPMDFETRYLRMDEDGDKVLKDLPCPFLGSENRCTIYEQRPKACRAYPHTDHPNMKEVLDLTRKNASCCPAVAEMVLRLMESEA